MKASPGIRTAGALSTNFWSSPTVSSQTMVKQWSFCLFIIVGKETLPETDKLLFFMWNSRNQGFFPTVVILKSTLYHNPLKDPGVPLFAFDMFRKALDNVVDTFCCFIIFELTGQKLLNLE